MCCIPTGQFAQGWSSSMFILSVLHGMLNINTMEFNPGESNYGKLPKSWKSVKLYNMVWRGKCYDIEFKNNITYVTEKRILSDIHYCNRD